MEVRRVEHSQSQLSLVSVCKESQKCLWTQDGMEGEIRSDGRGTSPRDRVRDRILKERALKIMGGAEGMTTDDDTMM